MKAVIFDLDGTLLDIESIYLEAAREVLAPHGVSYGMEEHRDFLTKNTSVAGESLVRGTTLTLELFNQQRGRLVAERSTSAREISGAVQLLEALSKRQIRLGLATNSPSQNCHRKIAPRSWKQHFQAITCGDHPSVKEVKPAPDIYLTCAGELGVTPAECLVFEDSPFGVEAAHRAGMQVIALRSPYVEEESLTAAERLIDNFHPVIHELDQLLELSE